MFSKIFLLFEYLSSDDILESAKNKLSKGELDESDADPQKYDGFDAFADDAASASNSDVELDKKLIDNLKKNPEQLVPQKFREKPVDLPDLGHITNPEDKEAFNKQIDDLTGKINDYLGLGSEVKSPTDLRPYHNLVDHLKKNTGRYMVNGHLAIEMHIRYFLCTYILIFMPAEFIIAIPKLFFNLMPEIPPEVPFLSDFMAEVYTFLDFIREESDRKFLITFTFGRKKTLVEDLEFLLSIPAMIFDDFDGLLNELLSFELNAAGYKEYKTTRKK